MRTTLTLLLVCFMHSAQATTYYFSTLSGDDSRTSTQAKNSSTPWKTISKLNSFFSNLQPGDQVLFKRGETFYGSITVNKSGTSSAPIIIGAYGTGNNPIITSLVTLSGWKANSAYKGVYECTANFALGAGVNTVLLNDVQKPIGRYPNIDAVDMGYLTIESHNGRKSITDKQLSSYPNWTGAEVVARSNHWQINKGSIKSHSGNTIYFSTSLYTQDKFGYFIQNSIKTLDKLGEWYYNPSTKRLSMYFGSNSPSSYTVKASAINILVYAKKKSYVVFDNLTLKGANEYGFDINGGSKFQIKNCDVLFSGIDGVNASSHSYFQIENCTVSNSYNNGIAAGSYAIIRNNIVRNSYTVPGMGGTGDGKGAGLRVVSGSLAEYNQVINSGYVGIQMNGNNVTVKNNYIDSFCSIKDDGGGVYLYNGHNSTNTGRKIIGNIILNGRGAPEGTNTKNSAAQGIYLDVNIHGLEVTDNTIANSQRGLFLHDTKDVIVKNNTLYNNNDQLMLTRDGFGKYMKNNTITKNILFSKLAGQRTLTANTSRDDKTIKDMGIVDNNYYAKPMDNTKLILTVIHLYQSKQKKTTRDLADWKATYKKDLSSKVSNKKIITNPDANIKFIFNASQVSKTVRLDASYVDAKNNKYSNSITLLPYTSAVLIKNGNSTTQNAAPDAPDVSITSPVVNQSYSGPATIDMSAKATDKDGTISKVQFYNGGKLLHTEYHGLYTFTWNNVPAGNYVLTAKATDNDGLTTTSAPVNVSVVTKTKANKPPTVTITNPTNNSSFTSSATILLTANAKDADGEISQVQFYKGSTLLKTEYNSPYTYSWKNMGVGTYTLTAKAKDNKGAITTSAKVTVTVKANVQNRSSSVSSPDNPNAIAIDLVKGYTKIKCF
ncbi:MAG: Ig-like domain-containing protein [Segetibacter sp.]